MKKLKKLATGLLMTGTVIGMSLPVVLSPVMERVVFAADDHIDTVEGDAFEINASVPTALYNIYVKDGTAEMAVLSEQMEEDSLANSFSLYMLAVINVPGEHEIIVEDGNGTVVKTISVNVDTASSDIPPGGGDGNNGEQGDQGNGSDEDSGGNSGGEDNSGDQNNPQAMPAMDMVGFIPAHGGRISGTTPGGEFKPGEILTLKAEADKGYIHIGWVIRNMLGQDITKDLRITEDNTLVIPDYPIRISATFAENLIHEVELLDVNEKLTVGKPVIFTGHVKDNTDPRFFLLFESWINEYDTKGITSSRDTNEALKKEGLSLLDSVDAGDKYNYSVRFGATKGYVFADDVKLIYNGKEYKPAEVVKSSDGDGNEIVEFSGFLSFGKQTNPKDTKTSTKTVTRKETKSENVTQYVYKTYSYTTYKYVTRTVTTPVTYKMVGGQMVRVMAAKTGDSNNAAVWIALAIAAGGGVVSGILVGRRRKRNK